MEETTVITIDEYESFIRNQIFLDCLIGAGVDNWDGYQYAIDDFKKAYPEYKED